MKNRILVFGATGGTGLELVKQALEEGYLVSAFVRSPNKLKISDKNLSIIQGNVLEYGEVLLAVKDQDAVFCNLGMPPTNKSNLRTKGTANIVKAMEESKTKRFICQTSLGYGDTKELLPWNMKYIIVPFLLKNAFKDHELQEAVIEKSKTDWTIVRPGNMTNEEITKTYKHGFESSEKIKLKVSRADVAHFMLNQIGNNQYLRKKVGISY